MVIKAGWWKILSPRNTHISNNLLVKEEEREERRDVGEEGEERKKRGRGQERREREEREEEGKGDSEWEKRWWERNL